MNNTGGDKPLIVQSDRTLLLDVHAPGAEAARAAILPFAELEKSPEHIHTYRITPLSLWNAASAGLRPRDVTDTLAAYSRYDVPDGIAAGFADTMARYGKIKLRAPADGTDSELLLVTNDENVEKEIAAAKSLSDYLVNTGEGFVLKLVDRGTVKRELIALGWPVQDEAPLREGEKLEVALRETCASGKPFVLRDYQSEAARSVLGGGG
ncbi:MAG: helicase-associated domain-containing protein, partial [Spirochaetaceae bacterium]|nr:helicase-associated domain-containing protein [Spirochaetaceae bacterium]